MDQLLKVTSIPFQAVCFTQNARLLPADNVALERQKALARHNALNQRFRPGSSTLDIDYINQVNMAFSAKHASDSGSAPSHSPQAAASGHTFRPPARSGTEIRSSYTVQRGSFELRVAKGELSYIPPLVMTIITQYPDVEFEYIGGFNYVPPQKDSSEIIMNLTI